MEKIQKSDRRPEKLPRNIQVGSALSRALERGEGLALSQRTSIERLVGRGGLEDRVSPSAGEGASLPG
jgi:hypothetical protein